VVIAILSSDGDGTPSAELIATVQAAVNDEDTRPLGDRVTVQGAEIIEYAIDATLYLYPGRNQSRSLTLRWPR
jgi:phage-related baseplate assembly protein